jgi:hypothetical protein
MMRFVTLLGTPSITLLALVLDLLARRRLFAPRERRALLWFAAAAAIILYGSTLGYLPLDVYRAGFSMWAPIALAVVAIAIAPRSLPVALTLLAVLVAYDLPLFASVNLFDYAVDPILGIAAIVWAIATTFRRLLAVPA